MKQESVKESRNEMKITKNLSASHLATIYIFPAFV